jgi:argininosuccinate lyase
MTYNRDLQEDKRIVFHADDTLSGALDALGGMLGAAEFHTPDASKWVVALDLAEALVERGVPFREAHHVVGGMVHDLEAADETFGDLTAERLSGFDERFVAEDTNLLDVSGSVASRMTHGGGSLASVQTQLDAIEAFLGES